MKNVLLVSAIVIFLADSLSAGQISGDWQGELAAGSQQLRLFLQIAKAEDGGWRATLLNMGRGVESIPVGPITLQNSDLKFAVEAVKATYEGKVSMDGTAIDGTWTQDKPTPLRFVRATGKGAWQHTIYVTVEAHVTLEVIDWGGSGRPLVLLSGLGNTAHIFDRFAQKLTPAYHVYGITRGGFGISSAPDSGYSADRLGDDVLAVIDELKLDRPVLAGHSIAGEELSSIGSRHPEKVAGLIYLDATYSYAFYDPSEGDFSIDAATLQRNLEQLRMVLVKGLNAKPLIQTMLETDIPLLQKHLQNLKSAQVESQQLPASLPLGPMLAIDTGRQKYTQVRTPVLAICAARSETLQACERQSKLVENAVPRARFVILRDAAHGIFLSNEEDVLREINAFIAGLN